jgi:Flp pilus assembly protein TadG
VLVLTGLLMPALLGGVGLAVDTGVIGTARSQLQTAADAAALAGAWQLAQIRTPALMTTSLARARGAAITAAANNRVIARDVLVKDNPTNATTGEVVIGYLSPFDTATATPATAGAATGFNAVKVTAFRDAAHVGSVPSYFGRLFGATGSNLNVTGTAIMRRLRVGGFKNANNQPVHLLPIVLDVNTYNAMVAGTTTDEFTWNDATKAIADGGDGVTESRLYPVRSGNPGNWGTVNIGVTANSTSVLGDQIRYGITPAQLATFPNGRIELDRTKSPPQITFSGDPGISAGIKDDLEAIRGRPVFIPIYDQTGGNGNNAWFRVIKFAGVRILDVNFQGNPKHVIIQPADVLADGAVGDSGTNPPPGEGGVIKLYLCR